MLKNPFAKPAWQDRDPATRIAALRDLPEAQAIGIIKDLALTDTASDVRKAATAKILDLNLLEQIIQQETDPSVKTSAESQRVKLLLGKVGALSEAERLAYVQKNDSAALNEQLLAKANELALRQLALPRVTRATALADIALKDKDSNLRLAAVAQLEQLSTLSRIAETARTKDKQVAKAAEARLLNLKLAAADPEAVASRREALCKALEQLTKQHADEGELAALDAEWLALKVAPSADLAEKYTRARGLFLRLHEPEPELKVEAEAEPKPETATAAAPQDDLTIGDNAKQTSAPDTDKTTASAANKPSEQAVQADQNADNKKTAAEADSKPLTSKADTTEATATNQANNNDTDKTDSDKLKGDTAPQPEGLTGEQVKQHSAKATELLESVIKDMDAGSFTPARVAFSEAEALLKDIGQHNKLAKAPKRLLAQLRPDVLDMERWRHWGNNKERRVLCEAMEDLATRENVEAPERIKLVKAAQKAWKKLEDMEKRPDLDGPAAGHWLWQRFHKASNRAWEPAKPWLEEKSQEREDKLVGVKAILKKLETLSDSAKTLDWPALQELQREVNSARNTLRELPPQHSRKPSSQLGKLWNKFQPRLKALRKQNEGGRRQLIIKAQQAERETDLNEALQQIKRLQQEWKKAGAAERKVEQSLWTEFRSHCDAIYARRDEASKAERQEQNQARDEAKQLLKTLDNLSQLDDAQFKQQQGDIQKTISQWDDLPDRAKGSKLQQAFNNAQKKINKRNAAAANQQEADLLQQLRACGQICASLEQGSEPSDGANWESALASLPAPVTKAMQQRYEAAQNSSALSDKARQAVIEQSHDLCVALELAANLDTPNDDQQRRMAMQVQRLSAALQGEDNLVSRPPLSNVQHWYSLSGLPAEELSLGQQRIDRVVSKLFS